MRNSKRFLSGALAALLAFSSLSFGAFAAESVPDSSGYGSAAIWADGNPDVASADKNSLDVVKWFSADDQGSSLTDLQYNSNHYYLLLPSTAKLDSLTLWHTFSSNPKINGVEIISGKPTSAISGEGDYTVTVDGKSITLTVVKSQGVGSVFINTESGSMDKVHASKENKESGNILVVESDGVVDYDGVLAQVKGRGNTTWTNMEKKPYNIKLDKKASLFGMDESKKWCLLANAQDHSLIRNKVAYDLGDEIGIDYSPDSQYADVYFNGDYSGTYEITEKVEVGKNNLVKINDINDQMEKINDQDLDKYPQTNPGSSKNSRKYFDIPNDPDDITGGYLMEFDVDSKYNEEASGFVTSRGQCVVLKGPEYASKRQVEYISKFVQEMEDAIYSSDGKNSLGKHYSEYIDVESAALMYLIQEYSLNIDSGISSCFFYKDSDAEGDGKIHASPTWDFDVSFGNLENYKDGVSMMSTDQLFAAKAKQYGNGLNTIFAELCNHSDFNEAVKKLYRERFEPALKILNSTDPTASGEHIKSVAAYRAELEKSIEMNFIRWRLSDNILVEKAGSTFDSQFNYFTGFLSKRAKFMNKTFGSGLDDVTESYKVYFSNDNNWDNVYLYYWFGQNNVSWPGYPMTKVTNGDTTFYEFDFAAYGEDGSGMKMVINNGFGNGQQTEDLSVELGMIYIPEAEPYMTQSDAEAFKSYYRCSTEEFNPVVVIRTEYMLGDVDNDNDISAVDSLEILRIAVDISDRITADTSEKDKTLLYARADIDGDGECTSADALAVLRASVGLKDSGFDIGEIKYIEM